MSENYFFRPLLDSQGEPLCLTGKRGSSVYNNMIEFRNYMDNSNNFKKERITIDVDSDSWNIDQCKQKAHLNNSNFFIVGDFSHNSIAKDASYNCFLAQPDIITHNNYKNVLQHLISPINNFIDRIFGTISFNDSNDCFRETVNPDNSLNNIFGKNNTFVLYKPDFIKNPSLNLNDIKSASHFINLKNQYRDNYDSNVLTKVTAIRQALLQWCLGPPGQRNDLTFILEGSVRSFISYHNDIIGNNNVLLNDLAKLRNILNSYIVYLDNFEENLERKKRILKKLKSSGNGNNGRLEDNFTLIRTKYGEISILVIIIIITLIFSLKKK
tara:strand:+ start:8340 stop:9317 length:978 start_codon:yes stop_codon:yes gene_type:complete